LKKMTNLFSFACEIAKYRETEMNKYKNNKLNSKLIFIKNVCYTFLP